MFIRDEMRKLTDDLLVLESENQPNHSFLLIVICTGTCEECDIEVFPNFHTQNNQKYVTPESIDNDTFIYFNGNQIFERNLLIDFDQQLVQNTVSFEGYTMAYNAKLHAISQRVNGRTDLSAISACSS
jgi:hypothetical protein